MLFRSGVPVISSMGAGNKLEAGGFRAADIYETKMCPLAKVMRRELKKRGVKKLKVVYSEEEPRKPVYKEAEDGAAEDRSLPEEGEICAGRRDIPGSVAFVPSAAGLVIAGEVVKELAGGM